MSMVHCVVGVMYGVVGASGVSVFGVCDGDVCGSTAMVCVDVWRGGRGGYIFNYRIPNAR